MPILQAEIRRKNQKVILVARTKQSRGAADHTSAVVLFVLLIVRIVAGIRVARAYGLLPLLVCSSDNEKGSSNTEILGRCCTCAELRDNYSRFDLKSGMTIGHQI